MTDRPSSPSSNEPPVHVAEELTNGGNLARIRLDEAEYTLRITRQGKLILTK
ncbi:hemin uptake protein HemP [Shimia sp. R11_0]|nr:MULTISPECIES: hemin uptake protein HemP [Shimia]MBO9479418.1 hemin uptake protein HemP [Shimia sp. R11_0]